MRSLPSEILQMQADRVGPALLELAEDQWFDRKSARVKPTDLANAQIAFANAEGGTIVVGLRQGQVEGIDGAGIRHENGLRQAAIDFSDPMVRAHVSEVPCTNSEGDSDRLLIFEVEPSGVVHTNRKDEVFLRVGDESRRLTFTQRQELTYDKGQSVFDGSPVPGATSEDLDWELVYDFAERVGSADPARLLARRGLLRGDEVSAAAVLLFGVAPQRDFPNAFIRVLRYRGTVKGVGSQQQLLTDTRFDGTLEESLQQAVNTVRGIQPTARRLDTDGRFRDLPLIPEEVWLEAIVNAVIHRSYSLAGDHIRIDVFDDRVEVINPGRFPGLSESKDPLTAMRFARNPRIARVFAELGWAQELGEGIRRMFVGMRTAGLPAPVYQQTSGTVTVVLASTMIDPDVARELSPGWQDIVAALLQTGALRTGDVEELLDVTRPTAIRRLRQLEEFGIVRWIGQSPNDPNARWELADEFGAASQTRFEARPTSRSD